MAAPKHPPGPPMDLANMRRQGVHHLIAYCLNNSCRHQAIIDVSSYPGDAGPVVRDKGEMRQVRRARPADRCEAKLEKGEPGSRLARAAV